MAHNPGEDRVRKAEGDYSPHRSKKLPGRPPDSVWASMTEKQREQYRSWQSWYRDMLVDEERDKMRRENGY